MYYRIANTAALALILSGCATPPHTNLLVFGTNTVVGLKVGADATQTPTIQLAYARQELVLMPLLANTDGSGKKLSPCPAERGAVPPNPPTLPELSQNCKFVGTAAGEVDSYSVLASFGAKVDATSDITGPNVGKAKAAGGIAQYFATGLAARKLAEHGSSLVAVSEAATAEANAAASRDAAALAPRLSAAGQVASNLTAANGVNDVNLKAELAKLDQAAKSQGRFGTVCDQLTKAACAAQIAQFQRDELLSMPERAWLAAVSYKFP